MHEDRITGDPLCDYCNKNVFDKWYHSICDEENERFERICSECFKEENGIKSDDNPWCGYRYFTYKNSYNKEYYDKNKDSGYCQGMECPDEICQCGNKSKVLDYLKELKREENNKRIKSAKESEERYRKAEEHYCNVLAHLTSYGRIPLE